MRTVSINFHASTRGSRDRKARKHRLPKCETTGLARYRDRHQARQGARALSAGARDYEVMVFACPECRGHHVEKVDPCQPITPTTIPDPVEAFTASLLSRKRRYFLVDIENPTRGARASTEQVADFWRILKNQAPGIAPHDHVVIGSSRSVARKYRPAIDGPNVRWVVGANVPDGADHALLAAIDVRRVARNFDELVIVSGDGNAFADLARRAKRCGLSVQVVTAEHPEQRTMLSRDLAAVASTCTLVRLTPRTAGTSKPRSPRRAQRSTLRPASTAKVAA